MKTIRFYVIIFLMLLTSSCDNNLTESKESSSKDSDVYKLNITEIGLSYYDLEDTFKSGTIRSDENGNLFVFSAYKQNILLYSEQKGFVRIFVDNACGLLNSLDSIYYITNKINSSIYDIYIINSDLTTELVETIEFNIFWNQSDSIEFSINDDYVIFCERSNHQEIDLQVYNRNNNEISIQKIDIKESFYFNGMAINNNSIYLSTPEYSNGYEFYIYEISLDNFSIRNKYKINNFSNSYFGGGYLEMKGNNIFIGNENEIRKFDLTANDFISSEVKYTIDSDYLMTHSSYNSNTIYSLCILNDEEYITKINLKDLSSEIIYKPAIPNNTIINAGAISTYNDSLYVGTNNIIKEFKNDRFNSLFEVKNYLNKFYIRNMAINKEGTIMISTDSNEVKIVHNNIIIDNNTVLPEGISSLSNGDFIITSSSNCDCIDVCECDYEVYDFKIYDKLKNNFIKIFEMEEPNNLVYSKEITVLPNDEIAVSIGNGVRIYALDGTILREQTYGNFGYGYDINDIIYSAFWDNIVMINSSKMFFIDPITLEIVNIYKNDEFWSISDIDISNTGIIYLTSEYMKKVYRVEIME